MTQFVEYGFGVLKVVMKPDTPGYIRRTIRITQASGKPLSDAQWEKAARIFVRAMRQSGTKVHRVRFKRRK